MQNYRRVVFSIALLPIYAGAAQTADGLDGQALLEKNCSRCHAVSAKEVSPLKEAPNLWIVLRSYPRERLDFELAEGIGSKHRDMPQIQFTSEEIASIESYLFGNDDED